MFDELSHKIEIVLCVLCAYFATCTEEYRYLWTTCSMMAGVCLVIDLMFFGEGIFVFDPDYNHWKDVTEEKDFDFKTD
jgi:hypothetical protein